MVPIYNERTGVLQVDRDSITQEELKQFRKKIEYSPKRSIDLCIRAGLDGRVIFGVKKIEVVYGRNYEQT